MVILIDFLAMMRSNIRWYYSLAAASQKGLQWRLNVLLVDAFVKLI
jgi:hypothetical protein